MILISTLGLWSGCQKPLEPAPAAAGSGLDNRFLYVASGTCYAGGGNTVPTNIQAPNKVYRIGLDSGQRDITIADYYGSGTTIGDSPVSLGMDDDELFVMVENATTTTARRIERMPITSSAARSPFSQNTAALSAVLRNLKVQPNGDILFSKSSAVEYITAADVRLTKGANPYINAPAAPCATSTTLISDIAILSNGFIAFAHAATGQNRLGFVRATGYSIAGDCTVAQAAPIAAAFPTAMAYDSANSKLIVAYAGNATTLNINSIYVYDITQTSNSVAIAGSNKIYDASEFPATYSYLLYGIPAMTLDEETGHLYVATAISTVTAIQNFAIEKFAYDPTKLGTANNEVLTRVGTTPFYPRESDTRCIADLIVGN